MKKHQCEAAHQNMGLAWRNVVASTQHSQIKEHEQEVTIINGKCTNSKKYEKKKKTKYKKWKKVIQQSMDKASK